MMRRLLVLVLVAGSLIVAGRSALGCSCAYGDPRTSLARADAAFVGRLETKESPSPSPSGTYSSGQLVTYTFFVERSVKGDLGKKVEVESSGYGGSCGLGVSEGERIGLFLHRDGDGWRSGLCSQISPEALIEAAKPLPAPTSKGPIAFVLGGRYGPATTFALDRRGKTVAYGLGEGWDTTQASVCPGSLAVVEWGYTLTGTNVPVMAVRRFDRFDEADAMRIPELRDSEPNFNRVMAISCRDGLGKDVFVAVSDYGSGGEDGDVSRGRIVRIRGERISTLYSGQLRSAAFSKSRARAYITAGRGGEDVRIVDLTSGRTRRIARIPRGSDGLSLSPGDVRLAATMVVDAYHPTSFRMTVVDMTRNPARVRNVLLRETGAYGSTVWADDTSVVFVPGGGDSDRVQVFDHRLTRRGSFRGWHSFGAVVVDGTMYGTAGGKLLAANLPKGPARTLRTFKTPVTYTLAFVPSVPRAEVQKSPPPPGPSSTPTPTPTATATRPSAVRPLEPAGTSRALALSVATVLVIASATWLLWRRRRTVRT